MSDLPITSTGLSPSQQRTLALAAVFQSAKLVHLLATQGAAALIFHGESYDYLLKQSLSDTPVAQRFQDPKALRAGLAALERGLLQPYQTVPETKKFKKNQVLYYATNLLLIERKIFSQEVLVQLIHRELLTLRHRHHFFSGDLRHPALLAGFANLYLNTAGTLKMRLNVRGQPAELTNSANVDRIRACLFAGLQAAQTWHALGGRRWRFILGRRQVLVDLRVLAMQDRVVSIKT
ncbi:MAG: DUF489 family protein [Pseudomonadota bacterium]|nr:DUF489 family protein [Pseudomonadota bacterium]